MSTERLRVDHILCDGVGYCAEVAPELVALDDWGFPMILDVPLVDGEQRRLAKRVVSLCPRKALSIRSAAPQD